ncbi:MAG: hypothetical protein IIA70_03005 [Proteobacteria bacterium]|nr:hypothetical protein [Pseudomonadota bacterium]
MLKRILNYKEEEAWNELEKIVHDYAYPLYTKVRLVDVFCFALPEGGQKKPVARPEGFVGRDERREGIVGGLMAFATRFSFQ